MEVTRRRSAARNVVAGSVWESRMKIDEVKGGIKVFTGEENSEEGGGEGFQVSRRMKGNQNGGVSGKRKTWKSQSFEGIDRSPIHMRKSRSESKGFSDEFCKELSVSVDGSEKSLINFTKKGSEPLRVSDESCKELDVSVDEIEESPIQVKVTRSDPPRVSDESCKEFGMSDDEIEKSPIQFRKVRSDSHRVPDETPREFHVCKEKIIPTSLSNVGHISSPGRLVMDDDTVGADEKDEEEDFTEMLIDKKSFDVKEVNIPQQEPNQISEQKLKKFVDEEKKIHQIHEKPLPISPNVNRKPAPVTDRPIIDQFLTKPKKDVNEEKKKIQQNLKKPIPISANLNKQPSLVKRRSVASEDLTKPPPVVVSEVFERIPGTQNKLQSIVDLVMWRDVSKSAFVFGIGSFIMLSSSYTQDLSFSLISAISYLGLLYLGANFLYKSLLCRGAIDLDNSKERYMVGEEEAIWLVKLILPFINEFLWKLKSLFCGDPSTTMKLAVMLFVLARCGSSITVWKMVKLGFFGVFTVPRICSSYSTQLTGYGKFWIRRFRDAWDSCSHKKAVAAAIFTLVWNLSSMVARIWAVFLLVVAIRYYQESLLSEDWGEEEVIGGEDSNWREGDWGQRQDPGEPIIEEVVKEKKDF